MECLAWQSEVLGVQAPTEISRVVIWEMFCIAPGKELRPRGKSSREIDVSSV